MHITQFEDVDLKYRGYFSKLGKKLAKIWPKFWKCSDFLADLNLFLTEFRKTSHIFFEIVREFFVKFWRSLAKRRSKNLKNDSQRCCDRNRPKIIEIGAILPIFRPFEILGLNPAPVASIQRWGSRSSAEDLDPAPWSSIPRRGISYGIYDTQLLSTLYDLCGL